MKISCIIPTCDRPDFLKQAIGSVLRQTFLPVEIIIIDNGSQKTILEGEAADRAEIFRLEPYAGVSRARNFGARKAKGDYLAFLDDDDLWGENYLENAAKAIKEKNVLCVLSRIDYRVGGKNIFCKNPYGQLSIENLLTFNPGAGGSNIIISKEVFDRVAGYDENLLTSEDKSLVLELLRHGVKVETLPDNYVIAREHDGARLTDSKKISQGIYQFTQKYKHLMSNKQYLENWVKIFKYRYKSRRISAFFLYVFFGVIYKIYKII